MRFEKKIKKAAFLFPVTWVVACLIGEVFFLKNSLAENLSEDGSCASTFQTPVIQPNKKRKFEGVHASIREWIGSLSRDEIINFIPSESKIKLNERGISNSKMRKILSKLRDRINLDHGALFVIADSFKVIEEQLQLLAKNINSEPVLIRHAFKQLLLGEQSFDFTEISSVEKEQYREALSDYKMALKDPEFIKNKLLVESLMKLEGDPKQAIVIGSILNKAIHYQAQKYISLLNLVRARRDESVKVFSEVAQRHFKTEEILMTYLLDNLSSLNKHLTAHDLALSTFNHLLKESSEGLGVELQSLDLKKVSVTFQRWLTVHIKGNDLVDYGNKLIAAHPERYFSIQDRTKLNDSDDLQRRWDVERDGFKSIEEYLLKSLNSDRVFFID